MQINAVLDLHIPGALVLNAAGVKVIGDAVTLGLNESVSPSVRDQPPKASHQADFSYFPLSHMKI